MIKQIMALKCAYPKIDKISEEDENIYQHISGLPKEIADKIKNYEKVGSYGFIKGKDLNEFLSLGDLCD